MTKLMHRGHFVKPFDVKDRKIPAVERLRSWHSNLSGWLDSPAAKAAELSASKHLTPAGVRAQARVWAADKMVARLRDVAASISEAKAAASEIRARQVRFEYGKDDVVGFLRRQEIRRHFASLDTATKVANLMGPNVDREIVAAVYEVPSELTGISADLHASLEKRLVEAASPEDAAALGNIQEAIESVSDAARALGIEIEKHTGISRTDQAALIGATEAAVGQAAAGGPDALDQMIDGLRNAGRRAILAEFLTTETEAA